MPYLPDYQISVYTPADREVEVWKPMEIVLQGGRLVSLFQIKFENCTCPRSNWCHSSLIRNMFDCNHLCCARSLSEVVLYLQGLFLRLGNRDKIPGKKGRKSGAGEAGLVCWWQLPTAHGFQGCSGHNIGTDRAQQNSQMGLDSFWSHLWICSTKRVHSAYCKYRWQIHYQCKHSQWLKSEAERRLFPTSRLALDLCYRGGTAALNSSSCITIKL